jgi:hypothetical protein
MQGEITACGILTPTLLSLYMYVFYIFAQNVAFLQKNITLAPD